MDTIPSSPSSLGVFDMIKRSFSIYKSFFGRFLGYLVFQLLLIGVIIFGFLFSLISTLGSLETALANPAGFATAFPALIGKSAGLFLVFVIFYLLIVLVGAWFSAAHTLTANRGYSLEPQNSWSGTLKEATSYLNKLFPALLLLTIFVQGPSYAVSLLKWRFASLALINPTAFASISLLLSIASLAASLYSIYASIKLVFCQFTIVVEQTKIMDGFRRSMQLVSGRWWETFGRIMAFNSLLGLAFFVIVILELIFTFKDPGIMIIALFVTFLLFLALTPLVFVYLTVVYNEYRKVPAPVSPAAIPPAPMQIPPTPQI